MSWVESVRCAAERPRGPEAWIQSLFGRGFSLDYAGLILAEVRGVNSNSIPLIYSIRRLLLDSSAAGSLNGRGCSQRGCGTAPSYLFTWASASGLVWQGGHNAARGPLSRVHLVILPAVTISPGVTLPSLCAVTLTGVYQSLLLLPDIQMCNKHRLLTSSSRWLLMTYYVSDLKGGRQTQDPALLQR